jgi:hypothetical protein
MNNTVVTTRYLINDILESFHSNLYFIVNKYIIVVLAFISFITNMICCLIFVKMLKTINRRDTNQMFKYLLIKSVCDMLPGVFNLLLPLYSCDNGCFIQYTYFIQIWYIWFHNYLSHVFYMASGFLDIAASFDCAISIEGKFKWCQERVSFIIINSFIFITCICFYSFQIFSETIIEYSSFSNITETVHYTYSSSQLFKYRKIYLKFLMAERFLRDFIVLIILVIINLFILNKMIQIRKRKSQLQTTRTSNVIEAERAENRKIKMIAFLCIIFICGHFPFVIYDIFGKSGVRWQIFELFSQILFHFSFPTPIIVYFLFNEKFKLFFFNLNPFKSNRVVVVHE